MKVKEANINNKTVIQIYISKEELEKAEKQEQLQNLKKQKNNVVVFVSGENETEKVLRSMVQIMNNKVAVNC